MDSNGGGHFVGLVTSHSLIKYEPQSVKTSLNDEVIKIYLLAYIVIYELLKSYPENLMKLPPI